MRHFLASLIFVLAGCASAPAHADDIAYDAAPLQQCIARSNGERVQLEACKGAGANPCIATEGDSNMAMTLCWDREATTWREAVDAAVARLAAAAPAHADSLRATQAAWAAWAAGECNYRGELYEGGSGAQLEMVTCAAALAVDRLITLAYDERQL